MRSSKLRSAVGVLLFVLAAAPPSHAQAPSPARPKGLDGFHLVLLAAHPHEAKMPELPSSVMKALRDAGEILPYKSYALVDQAFVKGRGGSEQRVGLHYPKHDYLATVEAGELSAAGARIVAVSLTEVTQVTFGGGMELLSATFSASDGETVVVGTSRVRGSQQALVLLVTLVRSGTGNN